MKKCFVTAKTNRSNCCGSSLLRTLKVPTTVIGFFPLKMSVISAAKTSFGTVFSQVNFLTWTPNIISWALLENESIYFIHFIMNSLKRSIKLLTIGLFFHTQTSWMKIQNRQDSQDLKSRISTYTNIYKSVKNNRAKIKLAIVRKVLKPTIEDA